MIFIFFEGQGFIVSSSWGQKVGIKSLMFDVISLFVSLMLSQNTKRERERERNNIPMGQEWKENNWGREENGKSHKGEDAKHHLTSIV